MFDTIDINSDFTVTRTGSYKGDGSVLWIYDGTLYVDTRGDPNKVLNKPDWYSTFLENEANIRPSLKSGFNPYIVEKIHQFKYQGGDYLKMVDFYSMDPFEFENEPKS